MKFNRQKRVAKQLEIGKQRALKIRKKKQANNFVNSILKTYTHLQKFKNKPCKIDDLINDFAFNFLAIDFLKDYCSLFDKPINPEYINIVPNNLKEYLNKNIPKIQTNNNESLQISPLPKTL